MRKLEENVSRCADCPCCTFVAVGGDLRTGYYCQHPAHSAAVTGMDTDYPYIESFSFDQEWFPLVCPLPLAVDTQVLTATVYICDPCSVAAMVNAEVFQTVRRNNATIVVCCPECSLPMNSATTPELLEEMSR